MAYEVEIKSLLGTEENASRFKNLLNENLKKEIKYKSFSTQLNHYFENGDPQKLYLLLSKDLSAKAKKQMKEIISKTKDISIRTRKINDQVKFVMKASVGKDSSSNGVARIELEETVKMTLDKLDKKLQKAGYSYQAKWSRQRDEFQVEDITICFDKNAGYGYLVEFEKVLDNAKHVNKAREDILKFMKKLNVSELPQPRLERMFNHYNSNWSKYYGTNEVFNLK